MPSGLVGNDSSTGPGDAYAPGMNEPRFTRAEPADAGELFTLQRAAYLSEAKLYREWNLPPLMETLAETTAIIEQTTVLKAVLGSRIVATGRARQDGPTLHLGRFAVAPDLQGRGLGTRLIAALEATADPGTEHFALFTGMNSEPNLRLYKRCGYNEHHRSPGLPGIELVHLEKPTSLPSRPSR